MQFILSPYTMRFMIIAAFVTLYSNVITVQAYEVVSLGVSETIIQINGTFLGREIFIFGAQQVPGDIIIVLEGKRETVEVKHLRQKQLGMWMVDEIYQFDNIPSLYIVNSTNAINQVARGGDIDKLSIGIKNLHIPCNNIPMKEVFFYDILYAKEALIRHKSQAKFFLENHNISRTANNNLFYSKMFLPAKLKEGSYNLSAYLVQKGNVLGYHTIPIKVTKTGMSGLLSNLHTRYRTAYAILVISASMLVGSLGYYLISVFVKKPRDKVKV